MIAGVRRRISSLKAILKHESSSAKQWGFHLIANFTRRAGIDSMSPRTQVVLLDFDGTLAATHLAVIECARRTSAQLGHGLIA